MKKRNTIVVLAIFAIVVILGTMLSCSNKIEVSSEPIASTIRTTQPVLNVYIENSGSMDGYMCDGSEFKDCIYDFVSELNRSTKKTNLNYINSVAIPYRGDLFSYIKNLNPIGFKLAGGNRSNTDVGRVIGEVLANVTDTSVCILVSDFILDVPSKNAKNFLINNEITIKQRIIETQKRVPNLGVEILKLSSKFDGSYYYPDGKVEKLTNVNRPYYIWIFGDKNCLAKLNTDVPFSLLEKYKLSGIASFTNGSAIPFEIKNQSGTSKVVVPAHGGYHLMILADFRTTLQTDGAILDKSNFSFNNNSIQVDGVYPITDKKSSYTHFIKFTIPKGTQVAQEVLTFSSPKMPEWVNASNDETCANVMKNLDKTTGIKYLIQGVADAFKNETVSTTMQFNVKRK